MPELTQKLKKETAVSSNSRHILGLSAGIALAVIVALIPPPPGLDRNAMRVGGIFLCAIVFWIFNTFPIYVTAFLMCICWTVVADVEFSTVFITFSQPTWWLIIGALGIGLSISKSGLLKRVALLSIRLFPGSYRGQITALLCTGALISPLIPSTLAKMSIAGPMSVSIGETMGLLRREKPMAGLFCAAYVGYALTGPVFVSASFMAYIVLGVLPGEVTTQFTWMTWFLSMLPYGVVLLVGSALFLSVYYRPEQSIQISDAYIQARLQALGPLSEKEKKVLVILPVALLLWATESIHHIPSAVISLGTLCLFIAVGVLTDRDFHKEMNWSMIFFSGCVVGASSVFSAVGIDAWLVSLVGPFLKIDKGHLYSFVIVLVLVLYLSRFLIAEMTTAMTLFTLLLVPIATDAGVNPWIIGIICYASVYTWNTIYQNNNFLVAYSSTGGEDAIRFSHTVPMSVAYMVLNLVGLLSCIPLWGFLGYLS